MMSSNIDCIEVTHTFQFGVYDRDSRGIKLIDMPLPAGEGWKETKKLVAKGFRTLRSIRRAGQLFIVRFSAATGGNEWQFEVRDEGSCCWLHDMGLVLSANKANMPTVSKVVQWNRPMRIGEGIESSFRDPYGLKKQLYWPGGNHPYGPIKRGITVVTE
jgi:hypothetical protein